MPLPLERNTGHQLEGAGFPRPTGSEQQLTDGIPGDAGGHRSVGHREHLVLRQPLLLLAVLLIKPGFSLLIGALLGVLLLLLFGVNQILVLFRVIGPEHSGGSPLTQTVHGIF